MLDGAEDVATDTPRELLGRQGRDMKVSAVGPLTAYRSGTTSSAPGLPLRAASTFSVMPFFLTTPGGQPVGKFPIPTPPRRCNRVTLLPIAVRLNPVIVSNHTIAPGTRFPGLFLFVSEFFFKNCPTGLRACLGCLHALGGFSFFVWRSPESESPFYES